MLTLLIKYFIFLHNFSNVMNFGRNFIYIKKNSLLKLIKNVNVNYIMTFNDKITGDIINAV